MRLLSIFISIIFAAFLSSCGAFPTSEKFQNSLNSYHGMSVDKLVEAWGPPRASHVNTNKKRVYQWTQGGQSAHFTGRSYPWIGAQNHGYAPWNHALWPAIWPAWGGGLFNTGVSMSVSRPMYLDRSCILNITTDQNNIITGHNAIGVGCVSS